MLFFLVIVLLLAYIFEKISLNRPIKSVEHQASMSKRCVEPNETFTITSMIENHSTKKSLPCVRVSEYIPLDIHIHDIDPSDYAIEDKKLVLTYTFDLEKRQRVRRSVKAHIEKRGIYYIKDARLFLCDFLGLTDRTRLLKQNQSIIVYPVRLEDHSLTQLVDSVNGEVFARSFLLQDPMSVRGYREYTGCEPMKMISFSQSARMNDLYVKECENVKQESINIILDGSYLGDMDHYHVQRETTFALARSLIDSFEKRNMAYKIITNCYYEMADQYGVNVLSSEGNGGERYLRILEAISVSNGIMCKTEELIRYASLHRGFEDVYIYLGQRKNEQNEAFLELMKKSDGILLHTLYGEDYVNLYEEAISRKREEAV